MYSQLIRNINKGVNNLGGNVSYTDCLIDGVKTEIKGSSVGKNIDGFATLEEEAKRLFKTEFVDNAGNITPEEIPGVSWNRAIDSEARTLEELARELKATRNPDGSINWGKTDAKGTVNLYTEREPCPSCYKVIEQFKNVYKNIDINIIWDRSNIK